MNGFQEIFKRIELKYLMSGEQYKALREKLSDYIVEDEYGETQILNIYMDTPDYYLIRKSLEKPKYKEKLRLRSYGIPTDDTTSFVEIKKKYKGVVYKRRIGLPYKDALSYVRGLAPIPEEALPGFEESQIAGELDYFSELYKGLAPRVAVSYKRIALFGKEDSELRVTFDHDLTYRTNKLDLKYGGAGKSILEPGQVLMELKIAGAIPIEIARALSELKIWQTSFSKYGMAYIDIMNQEQEKMKKVTNIDDYKKEKEIRLERKISG